MSESENDSLIEQQEDDINELLKKDFIEADAPKYGPWPWLDRILLNKYKDEGGYKLDRSATRFFVPGMILFNIIFFGSGSYKANCLFLKIIWILGNLLWLMIIHNKRNEGARSIQGEIEILFKAVDRDIVLLSIITLFAVFVKAKADKTNNFLLGSSILSLIFGAFWYTFADEPLYYRNSRNLSASSLTLGLLLFSMFVARHYFC